MHHQSQCRSRNGLTRDIILHDLSRSAPLAGFDDSFDLLLVNKQIGLTLAGEPKHSVVEVLDPAAHDLAAAKLHRNGNLALTQRTQIERLLTGLARRRDLGMTACGQWRSHDAILDAQEEN